MVLTENISSSKSFPTSKYSELILMNEEEKDQNQNEGEGQSNNDLLLSSTDDEHEVREIFNNSNHIDTNDQEESNPLDNNSWDIIQEEELNAAEFPTNVRSCDTFWDDVRRSSQKLVTEVCTKAEEIDDFYKIQEKTRPYVQQVQTFAQSTRNLVEKQDIPTKAKHASEKATKQVRHFDDKYGVVDKVTGAAVGIGAIQLASGNVKSGLGTLAGAALFAAFGEKLKRDREDENELHLY